MERNKERTIDQRFKEDYENRYRFYLTRRVPVIIRLDGRSFSNFTKRMQKPYDLNLMKAMSFTMKELMENIQGAKLGYQQSDEISILLTDYETNETEAFFDYNLNKINSICASMATAFFNKHKTELKTNKDAFFDCRCFNVPKEEVVNYFYSRQLDCMRNSIQMAGQKYFSPKQLHGRKCEEIKEMLQKEKNIDFDSYPTACRRGICCYKLPTGSNSREAMFLDLKIPIFSKDRLFVQKWVETEEEKSKYSSVYGKSNNVFDINKNELKLFWI